MLDSIFPVDVSIVQENVLDIFKWQITWIWRVIRIDGIGGIQPIVWLTIVWYEINQRVFGVNWNFETHSHFKRFSLIWETTFLSTDSLFLFLFIITLNYVYKHINHKYKRSSIEKKFCLLNFHFFFCRSLPSFAVIFYHENLVYRQVVSFGSRILTGGKFVDKTTLDWLNLSCVDEIKRKLLYIHYAPFERDPHNKETETLCEVTNNQIVYTEIIHRSWNTIYERYERGREREREKKRNHRQCRLSLA